MIHALRAFLLLIFITSPALAAPDDKAAAQKALADAINTQIRAALDEAQQTGDLKPALPTLQAAFDLAIAYAADNQPDTLEDAAFALRLARQLNAADPAPAKVKDRLAYLRADGNDPLARALAFTVNEQEDKLPGVYGTLDALRAAQKGKDRLAEFATLTAAICVVHDRPLGRNINENPVKSAPATDLWSFYAANEKKMYYGMRNVPAHLLVFVVDSTASIDDMNWALKNYAGDRAVGAQFFNIAYDYEHFLNGAPKKVTKAGFNLPNIRKHGGVCADQAYFAVTVGKSIGVPAVYTYGAGGQVSHAWVGYLQQTGRTATWNFDEGRYDEYQGVRGNTEDPQSRKIISDSEVSVLAEMIGASVDSIHEATAFTDAAARLGTLTATRAKTYPPAPPTGIEGLTPRPAAVAAQLELVEDALRKCAGYKPAWDTVAALAQRKQLTLDDKRRWAETLDRMCGGAYPDFTVDILAPMIATIEDPDDRATFWTRLGKNCGKRKDLAAFCAIEQGKMWEATGQKAKAYDCYTAVINTYINDGPFALEALARAEKMLADQKRPDVILEVYQQAFNRTTRPDFAAVFATQSNWYKIGNRYAGLLEAAGDRRAQTIRQQLGGVKNAN